MDDDRVWKFERSLWLGDAARYRALIDDDCLMVMPAEPFVASGKQAMEAAADMPRWLSADFSETHISRPETGLIVVAYKVTARRQQGDDYIAYCTSTYRRLAHEEWRVIQHQQTPPIRGSAGQS